ncbi:MAG: hypothetical protein ACLFV6_05185 [Spirulinaceae cyanobacterium]
MAYIWNHAKNLVHDIFLSRDTVLEISAYEVAIDRPYRLESGKFVVETRLKSLFAIAAQYKKLLLSGF